jgi:tetratricopeptide (TPR) repeat protein
MNRRWLYIISWSLACACAAGPPTPRPAPHSRSSYERLVAAARTHVERGRSERALELARRAVDANPERPEAYLVVGLAHAQTGKLDESAAQYEMARERGSTERRLFAELASVYDVAQRYDDAVRVYRERLAMAPDDAEMRQELGLTLLLLKQFDAAVTELRTVAKADPDNTQACLDLGYALLRAGRPREAAALFEQAIRTQPSRHDVELLLARARAACGEADAAIAILDNVIAARPGEAAPLRMRARMLLLTGKEEGAAADYRRLLELAQPGDPAVLLGYAGVLIALDQLRKAEALLHRVQRDIGEHPVLSFRQAQIAWRRGNRRAIYTLAGFARDNPTDVEAWREVHAAARKFKDRKLRNEATNKLRSLGDL